MFVRNLLQAGDYATLVPVGIPITLQYSEKGTMQKVYHKHDSAAREELSNAVIANLMKYKQVPHNISIQGGTTWIQGVLYTESFANDPGELPDCVFDTLLKDYLENPAEFEFYAGNVESLAQKFSGALSARQWLATSKFKLLPGYLISGAMNEAMFLPMVKRDYPFRFPLIASYIVFRNDQILYLSTGLSQWVVKSVECDVNESGVITAKVTTSDDIVRHLHYYTILKYNVTADTCLVATSEGNIKYSEYFGEGSPDVSDTIACSCCGKKLIIPRNVSTVFKCSDPQCNSVLYPRAKQLLEGFEIDTLSYEDYKKIADKIGVIFSLPDLFDTDEYRHVEVTLPLNKAVRAIIPKDVLPGSVQISQLCDACNNSKDTLLYYIQHVDKLKTELDLDVHTFTRFFKWLLNPENASDVVELLSLPNLTIVASTSSFEGAPIFRNKTILITGTFRHGSLADMKAILGSYAANVVTSYVDGLDCVLVGDIEENIKGNAIHKAKEQSVPVFKETEFFKQYDIDADMAQNL